MNAFGSAESRSEAFIFRDNAFRKTFPQLRRNTESPSLSLKIEQNVFFTIERNAFFCRIPLSFVGLQLHIALVVARRRDYFSFVGHRKMASTRGKFETRSPDNEKTKKYDRQLR